MNRLALFLSLVAALFAAACGGSGSVVTPPPPVGGFTTASLKGQYAFSMSGSDVSGAFFARIGAVPRKRFPIRPARIQFRRTAAAPLTSPIQRAPCLSALRFFLPHRV